jgi:hypothetical protein
MPIRSTRQASPGISIRARPDTPPKQREPTRRLEPKECDPAAGGCCCATRAVPPGETEPVNRYALLLAIRGRFPPSLPELNCG